MIIEEEDKAICMYSLKDILNPPAIIQVGSPTYFTRLLEIQSSETCHNLHHDLTEHIWQMHSRQHNDDGEKNEDVDDENEAGDDEDDNGDEYYILCFFNVF